MSPEKSTRYRFKFSRRIIPVLVLPVGYAWHCQVFIVFPNCLLLQTKYKYLNYKMYDLRDTAPCELFSFYKVIK